MQFCSEIFTSGSAEKNHRYQNKIILFAKHFQSINYVYDNVYFPMKSLRGFHMHLVKEFKSNFINSQIILYNTSLILLKKTIKWKIKKYIFFY